MIKAYKNFDLRIRGSATDGYTVEAALSDGSSLPSQPFILPSNEGFRRLLDGVLCQSNDRQSLQAVGKALFKALFPARVARLWARARGSLGDEKGLRIRLHIAPPELMSLPWELIFEEEYIGLRPRFPVVRYLDLPDPPQSLVVQLPLRVLIAVSQPKDTRPLDIDAELANARKALAQLSGKVTMDVFASARRNEFLTRLRQDYHVLHYIGHGKFQNGEGHLILEDSEGRSDPVPASLLGQMVVDSSLRLVVLNACETSATGAKSTFSGVAHQLVRAGMPTVVAMQVAIADQSAVAFSREFYGALADGWPVDTAVQEGRRGIATALGGKWNECVDWAIPTLYMRAPDGLILKVQAEEKSKMIEKKEPGPSVGGDNIQITIGDGAENVIAGKNVRQVTHETIFHGPVHGSVHTGSGDIHVGSIRYGLDTDDLKGLFGTLRSQVDEQAPSDKKTQALQKVDALEQALEEDEPDLGMMESVLNWFKKNIPQLAGTVTSVIFSPIVGKVVEAAGELIAAEFRRRFGGQMND